MAYEKPEVLAQNEANGSFAAGCPPSMDNKADCRRCELSNQ
jgi:hypothetical protein